MIIIPQMLVEPSIGQRWGHHEVPKGCQSLVQNQGYGSAGIAMSDYMHVTTSCSPRLHISLECLLGPQEYDDHSRPPYVRIGL